MRTIAIILLNLITTLGLAQVSIKGQVIMSDNSKGLTMSNSKKSDREYSLSIKTSKDRKGELVIDSMIVPIRVIRNDQVISSQTTDKKGRFKLDDLEFGEYQILVDINKYLRVDTVINLAVKKANVSILLDDSKLWKYIDSTQLAKYPYNAEIAKEDLENGVVKILTAGLPILSDSRLDSIVSKYGFEYEAVAGCVLAPYQQSAMDSYNKIVFEYLEKTNPSGWRDSLNSDIQVTYIRHRK